MTRTIQEVRAERDHHLSIPENRLKYAFIFLDDHGFNPDDDYAEEVRIKCYNGIAKWSDKLDTSEAHY
tara:strand:+ start:1001 stop:1204 length:204 start_codon:yes stop_codon:yes gene_type:complete